MTNELIQKEVKNIVSELTMSDRSNQQKKRIAVAKVNEWLLVHPTIHCSAVEIDQLIEVTINGSK